MRQAYEPIYRKYRAVVPSIFTRQGDARVHVIQSDPALVIGRLKRGAIFTLDTAADMRWGLRLVHAPNMAAYLPCADVLDALEAEGVLVPDTSNTFIYAPPFPVGPRLFSVVTEETPPHEELPHGFRVVTVDRLVREFIGTFGLRLDLLAALDLHIQRDTAGREPLR